LWQFFEVHYTTPPQIIYINITKISLNLTSKLTLKWSSIKTYLAMPFSTVIIISTCNLFLFFNQNRRHEVWLGSTIKPQTGTGPCWCGKSRCNDIYKNEIPELIYLYSIRTPKLASVIYSNDHICVDKKFFEIPTKDLVFSLAWERRVENSHILSFQTFIFKLTQNNLKFSQKFCPQNGSFLKNPHLLSLKLSYLSWLEIVIWNSHESLNF
jgi:hypothetical protein